MPRFVHRPITPVKKTLTPEQTRQIRIREMQKKREQEEKARREKVFEVFTGKKGGKLKQRPKASAKKTGAKQDAFSRLSRVSSEGKKPTRVKRVKDQQAFAKLKKLTQQKKKK